MRTPTVFLIFSAAISFSAPIFAFQQQKRPIGLSRLATQSLSTPSNPLNAEHQQQSAAHSSSLLWSAHFANSGEETTAADTPVSFPRMTRNRLRQATGFSFTVFRATLRGITGISLTALYAGAIAASGLWIRQTMSVLLSVFPSGFRYFLQPFLVMYYTPLILVKSLTSPTNRKQAVAKHNSVRDVWKDAVVVAEKTKNDGYWPVVVDDDGYFELTKPPSVSGVLEASETDSSSDSQTEMAEALAAAVEQAMELKSESSKDEDEKKK